VPPSQSTPLNWPAIGVVVVAVINIVGWFVVHFLTKRRETQRDQRIRDEADAAEAKRQDERSRTSRTNFRSAICGLRVQVGKVENERFQDWFSHMQVEVEKQCALVESAIDSSLRTRFGDARKECSKPQTQNDLMDSRAPVGQLPSGFDRLPEVTYERGRARARDILDRLLSASQ
jgi:hypothetical protein